MKIQSRNKVMVLLLVLGLIVPSLVLAEELEFVTYYPSSVASVDRLTANRATIGPGYSSVLIGDGELFVENRIGIGTITPSTALEVAVPAESTRALRLLSGPNAFLDVTPTQPGAFNTVLDTVNNRNLILQTGTANVGIGTTTPDVKLHVVGAENDGTVAALKISSGGQNMLLDGNEIDSDTTLFLNHNSNNTVVMATGGGSVAIGVPNPSRRLHVEDTFIVTDADNSLSVTGAPVVTLQTGSAHTAKHYPFIEWRDRSGTRGMFFGYGQSGNYIDLNLEAGNDLRIRGGRVGIGTHDPLQLLDVRGIIRFGSASKNEGGLLYATTVPGNKRETILTVADGRGDNNDIIWIGPNTGVVRGEIKLRANTVFHPAGSHISSDARLKADIQPIPNALDKITFLRGVSFRWKDRGRGPKRHMGLIGQDVEKVFPEVMMEDEGLKYVAYTQLTGALVEAVKELKIQNDSLKQRVEQLEKDQAL